MEICFCGHARVLIGRLVHDENGICTELIPNNSADNKNKVTSMIPCDCKGFKVMIDTEKGINNILKNN